jgi:UDP-N-acetylmuramyl pentapeptide synthase
LGSVNVALFGTGFQSHEYILKVVDKSKIQFVTEKVVGSSESSVLVDVVAPAVEASLSVRAYQSMQNFLCSIAATEKENLRVKNLNSNSCAVDVAETRFESKEFQDLLVEIEKVCMFLEFFSL